MVRRSIFSLSFVLAAAGCQATTDVDHDDHSEAHVTFEGEEIVETLDSELTSKVFESQVLFERLGMLWDAPANGTLQVRVSEDGELWSEWGEPVIHFEEEGAFAGHVDAPVVGRYYQYRLSGGDKVPSFVAFEPIEAVVLTPDEPFEIDDEFALEPIEAEIQDGVAVSGSGIRTGIGSVTVHSRGSWGARSPRCALARQSPQRITIHHTVGPNKDPLSAQARMRQIQALHMFSNGWCDIGYNFVVSRDGRLWRARGSLNVGAHTEGANTGNIGISFMGNYMTTSASSRQRCNSAKLIRYLAATYSGIVLRRSEVKGHRDFNSTACPGTRLYGQLDSIVRTARNGCD